MRGDRERCLEAGFDGYVSKPIQFKELFDTIDRLAPAEAGARRRTPLPGGLPADAAVESGAAFDERVALQRTGGDRELLKELIAVFLHEIPGWMKGLRTALDRGDAVELARVAHAIKGAVDSCGASGAFDAAMLVERIGAAGELSRAAAAVSALDGRIERARAELGAYVRRDGGGGGGGAGGGGGSEARAAVAGAGLAGNGRA
jgi:HPt (histidine-containing phosphotransfer) domain-containing protein